MWTWIASITTFFTGLGLLLMTFWDVPHIALLALLMVMG